MQISSKFTIGVHLLAVTDYLGEDEKARSLATRMGEELMITAGFYLEWGRLGEAEFEAASRVLLYIADVCKQYGDKALADAMIDGLEAMIHHLAGTDYALERDDTLNVAE